MEKINSEKDAVQGAIDRVYKTGDPVWLYDTPEGWVVKNMPPEDVVTYWEIIPWEVKRNTYDHRLGLYEVKHYRRGSV